jgi:hypothetical protein
MDVLRQKQTKLGFLHRRTVAGMLFGCIVAASTMAGANSGGGWFSSLLASTGSGDPGLVSQQDSVVAASLTQETTECTNGDSGTVGEAIKTAMTAHNEVASATPKVERLFDVNSNCFSMISQIFDLSFAIPSMSTYLAAAAEAVRKYAEKKICNAVYQVTDMVTKPLNQAIGRVNQLEGFASINGMSGAGFGNGMVSLDQNLGDSYHQSSGQNSYSVNTNPFNTSQTTFNGGSQSGTQLNNQASVINGLVQQVASQSIKVQQLSAQVEVAYNQYSNCATTTDLECANLLADYERAQQRLAAEQATLANLQAQLDQMSGSSAEPDRTQPGGSQGAVGVFGGGKPQNAENQEKQEKQGWWSGIASIFK